MAQAVTGTQRVRGERDEATERRQVDAQSATDQRALSARLPLIGLLAVQIFIGYEWFISGITKIVRGGFPAGLADDVAAKSPGAPAWYANSILDNVVIPHANAFGYLIEFGEVFVGVTLVAGAAIWLFQWERLPRPSRAVTLGLIAFAALAGVFINVNLHLFNGSPHPWLLPGSGFDEGVDLDSLMPAIQLAIAGVAGVMLWEMRTPPETPDTAKRA